MFNDMFPNIHWLAVLAGAAAYWLLGAIWYSVLFSKPWVKMHNVKTDDPDAKKGMAGMFIGSFVLMFIASTGLGILSSLLYIADVAHAAKLGLLVGICFNFTSIAINFVYLRKPTGLYAIDGGYQVVGTVLAAIVIKLLS
jgi:hypothetical protein